ncbi:hypothetical protein K8T06_06030 [bacterium]|nr:hypothetical protein [bacterium]
MKYRFTFVAALCVIVCFTMPASADPDCTAIGDLSDVCEGTTGLSVSVPTGPMGTTYLWNISSNGTIVGPVDQPSVTYSADGSGMLTLSIQVIDTLMNQCNEDYDLMVFSNPTASITANGVPGPTVDTCSGIGLDLDGNPSGGSGSWITHEWTGTGAAYLDSTTIQDPVFSCSTPGTYNLSYRVVDDETCEGSDSITITVHTNPAANITANGVPGPTADACSGIGLDLDGNPSGGSGPWITHEWTGTGAAYLDSTTIQDPVFTCSTPGTYNLSYRVIDDETCEGSDSITITVHTNPSSNITVDGSPVSIAYVCALESLTLNGNPSGGSGSWSGHLWEGTGAVYLSSPTIVDPTFNSDTGGTYNLVYTVTDTLGCTGSDSLTIEVYPHPNINILSNGIPAASDWFCISESASLDGNPSGGSGTYTNHEWTGDPGLLSSYSIQNPTFQTSVPGDYTLIYTVTDDQGCQFSDSIDIHVDTPSVDIEANGNPVPSLNTCAGITVDLNGNPSGGSTGRIHLWTGDTSPLSSTTVQEPDFSTNTTGIYNLVYTVTDNQGCFDSDTISITVYPNPSVEITMAGFPVDTEWLCIDEPLNLSGNPTGGSGIYSTHYWYGNGAAHLSSTSIESPVFQSNTPGYFTIYYRVTDSRGCRDTDVVHIMVADPIPDIEANGSPSASYSICAGDGLILDGNPKDGSRLYVSHVWTGDTGPLDRLNIQSPIFNTSATGSYSLVYTVIDDEGCIGTDSITIIVNSLPTANAGSDNLVIYGESVTLDASGSSCTGGCSYEWEVVSGDSSAIDEGQTSVQCIVSPEVASVFQVTVTDSNGCTDSDVVVITVGNVPLPTISTIGLLALLGILGLFIGFNRKHRSVYLIIFILLLSCLFTISTSAQITRFVDPLSTSPGPPYTNWQSASHTIQTVIDYSNTGDTIIVANGTYSENIQLNKDVKVISWCLDPESCIIDAPNPIQPAVTIIDPDIDNHQIVLAGFKIQEGSKAIYISDNFYGHEFPLIRNCIIDGYSGIGVHGFEAVFAVEFCTLTNNNVALFAADTNGNCRSFFNIIAGNSVFGLQLDTSYYEMKNNCFFDNGQHIFGAPVAYCDEWSAEALPNGVDPQFIPGTFQLADTSPCKDFIQPDAHYECYDTLFDMNESPYDLGAYGGFGTNPLVPYIDLSSRNPEPGDYLIAANSDIEFTVWDEGTAGLDLNTLSVVISQHGSSTETYTLAELNTVPVPIYGPPPQDCLSQGYEVTLQGNLHALFSDFANVHIAVFISDRNPSPGSFSNCWDFFADDLNPPELLSGFYPSQGAINVPIYGPIEMDIFDAGVGYDPESIELTLNGDPLSLNLSEVTWTGDHLTIIPRPRFIEGQSNTLTFQIDDFYGNIMPLQTIVFTCGNDTDLPFVPGITGPAASPNAPALAPRPVPDDGSSDSDTGDPITFYFQDFSSTVNLETMQVAINTGTSTYRYYFQSHGGSNRIFQVSGDPQARLISCFPQSNWPLGRQITVTVSAGTDTASSPNTMQTAVYSFQCGTAPIPSLSTLGLILLLITIGGILFIRKR